MVDLHGGNLIDAARRLGCDPSLLIDASASLVPFGLPPSARWALANADFRSYPDRSSHRLRQLLADQHQLDSDFVLPGNGAAELFTWAARDAAAAGVSVLPQPGFADYARSLCCWDGATSPQLLRLHWDAAFPQPIHDFGQGDVLWITNPHNPTGQLWSRASLMPFLDRYRLVICDEAFLPLVPNGENQSMVPLVAGHPNLVVIRSLTKLFGIAGVRLGYALAQPPRLRRWAQWRDPWPINALATTLAQALLSDPRQYARWCRRVQRWTAREGAWLQWQLSSFPGFISMPSAANFLLIRGVRDGQPSSLQPLREALEQRHRILLRDCRSFQGLDDSWLRIGYQSRRGNRRIIRAMKSEIFGSLNRYDTSRLS